MKQSKFQELVAEMLNDLLDEQGKQKDRLETKCGVYYATGYLNAIYDVASLFGADIDNIEK